MTLFDTPTVLVQGITGHHGAFHTKGMLDAGTNIVAGVTPGKGGETVHDLPVYNSVSEARTAHPDLNTSVVFVPAAFAKSAVIEAIDAGISQIIVITEGIPVHDALVMHEYAAKHGVTLVGPNCPGLIVPGSATSGRSLQQAEVNAGGQDRVLSGEKVADATLPTEKHDSGPGGASEDVNDLSGVAGYKLGIIAAHITSPGNTAIISRSGTLTYELADALTKKGIGQSIILGIGGDPVPGMNFVEALKLVEANTKTEQIILVGEIGGMSEQLAADYIAEHVTKPVYGLIVGHSAPSGQTFGHAGAIVGSDHETADAKTAYLGEKGITTANTLDELIEVISNKSYLNSLE